MSTQKLAKLIDQKYDVLVQLRQLGRQQASLIHADDVNSLLVLLSGKQTLLNQLQTIERHLAPYRDEDPECRVWTSQTHRQQCAEVARTCEALLSEILKAERESEAEMERRRDATAARLEESGSAVEACKAYMQPPERRSRRLDLSSDSY